nr:hypothetical protein [Providencia sp.]
MLLAINNYLSCVIALNCNNADNLVRLVSSSCDLHESYLNNQSCFKPPKKRLTIATD